MNREHSTPNFSAYERYIDPDKKDMAIRIERTDSGRWNITYNGRPARFTFKEFARRDRELQRSRALRQRADVSKAFVLLDRARS